MSTRSGVNWGASIRALLGAEDTRRNPHERSKSVYYFSQVFVPGAFIFAAVDIYLGHFLVAGLLLALAVTLLFCKTFLSLNRVTACELFIMSGCTAVSTGLIYHGGMVGSGIYWVLLFPFLAFFIRGQRNGWFWVLLLCGIVAALAILQHFDRVHLAYTYQQLIYFLGTFFFFTLLAAGLNLLRSRYVSLLEVEVDAQSRNALDYMKKLEYLALYDPITDLPNRNLAKDRLAKAIENAKRFSASFAVGLFDIERFHEVNTLVGHQKADKILKMIANRLKSHVRGVDTVARLEGDEFMIIWPGVGDDSIDKVVSKVLKRLDEPFDLDDDHISISISFGVVIYPQHGDTVSTLMRHATTVHRRSKDQKQGYVVYQSEWQSEAMHRIQLLRRMRDAIANDVMSVVYQPQVSLADGRVASVEALVRWTDAEEGAIPPSEFIPLAEQSRLIEDITFLVLTKAAKQNSEWRDKGMDIEISINLSARHLIDLDLPDKIVNCISRYNGLPRHFMFEITETDIMEHPDRALKVMKGLNTMGFPLSIDDFGTGYSSLSYLRNLPVAELKIDQSFIREYAHREGDREIVFSVISLAHAFTLRVVAEGVEDRETMQALKSIGADKAQGYYICRPVPAEQFEAWFSERHGVYIDKVLRSDNVNSYKKV
jgi:diguanylate cyclase (GGDEF)-like protein